MVSLVLPIRNKTQNIFSMLGMFLQSFDVVILTWEAVSTQQQLFRCMEFKGTIRKGCQ